MFGILDMSVWSRAVPTNGAHLLQVAAMVWSVIALAARVAADAVDLRGLLRRRPARVVVRQPEHAD
jgi:hypothetical protein